MVTRAIQGPASEPSSSAFPLLMVVQGEDTRTLTIDHTPFTIGRKADKDLVLTDPRVSRDHAVIVSEEGEFFLVDQGSKHGTYVNGERTQRTRLQPDARLEFGARDGVFGVFRPQRSETNVAREFLHQISDIEISTGTATNDLEKLTLFLEAARKLNTAGVLDEILVTLVETTLRLTGAERGYIFLLDNDKLRLAAGRNAAGLPLPDDKTISHSILEDAVRAASEFLVSDTSQSHELAGRNSIIAYDLRTVICIPLRKMQVQAVRSETTPKLEAGADVIGALYLDARYTSHDMSGVGHDLLRAIAREAASLVENARLVQAEEAARRYQQELSIAATIQQRLMSVIIPEVPFATLRARNISCKEVGGDFFDAVKSDTDLSVVISDVSGKGITAALLANTLQGMIYSHLAARLGLSEMVTAVNQFLCKKHIGEKYATLVVIRLHPDGRLEYVNCGHVPPLIVSGGTVSRPECSNLPVGLLAEAGYDSGEVQLRPGDRVVLVTDGVTEAENAGGEFFEDQRLQEVAATSNFEGIFTAVSKFCAGTPLADDCTLVELEYLG